MNRIGELIEVISRRAGLDNVGLPMRRRRGGTSDDAPGARTGRSPEGQVRALLDVVGSDLLDFGQLIIAGMKMTTGDGEPDIGAQFDQGQKDIVKAGETLRAAGLDDKWDGAGSRAYADQNTRQQIRAETMADADRAVQSVLAREALQIKLRRDTLDDQSDLLAKTSYATFPMQFIPRYGEAAKLAIEGGALQGALQVCAYALYQLNSEVSDNAAELSQAVGRYAGVADGVDAPGGGFNPPETPGGGGPPNTEPTGPTDEGAGGGTTSPPAGGSGPADGGGGGAVMRGALPQNTSIGGLPPPVDPPRPGLPMGPTATTPGSSPSAPIAGMPAPGGAAGALASVAGSLAGFVTGVAIAAGQAAAAGHDARADGAQDEDVDEAVGKTEEDRDGKPQDQAATAEPGPGAADRAPIGAVADPEPTGPPAPLTDSVHPETSPGPAAGMAPQDTKLGEGVHVGG